MADTLPMAYEMTYFDEAGLEIDAERPTVRTPITDEPEREVQFMALASTRPDAVNYSVRLLRPHEIKASIKAERKARGEDFMSQVAQRLGQVAVVDNVFGMLAALDERDRQLI